VELTEVGHGRALRVEEGEGRVGSKECGDGRRGREERCCGGGGGVCGQWRHCHPLLVFSGNLPGFFGSPGGDLCVPLQWLSLDKITPHPWPIREADFSSVYLHLAGPILVWAF
jgi:hypothetical protein